MAICKALFVTALLLSLPLQAEESNPEKPVAENTSAAHPPWSFTHALQFDILDTESSETRLGSKRIDYKDWGSHEARIRAALSNSETEPAKIQLNVSTYSGFKRNWEGVRWDYSLDKGSFTEMRDDKVLRQVKLAGKPDDHAALKSAVSSPWAELVWKGDSSSTSTLTAQGLAQPLAEAASLERQIEILLPPIPSTNLFEGSEFHQDVAFPSAVPLKGVSRVKLTYRVASIVDHRYLEITFEGEESEKISSAFEWGGIAVPEMTVTAKIKGKLTRDSHHETMTAGLIEYDVDLASKKAAFKSQVKGKSEWKRKE
jgi:hypothetical protein